MKATHHACYIDIEFDKDEQQSFVFDKDNGKLFVAPYIRIKANGVLVKIPGTALKLDELDITEITPDASSQQAESNKAFQDALNSTNQLSEGRT